MVPTPIKAITHATPASSQILAIFKPLYHAMIVPVKARMKSVPMSGIARITKRLIALIRANWGRNGADLMTSLLLEIQYDIKNTYPSLKNSAGCIFGSPGKSTHPLAVPFVALIPGINTQSWKRKTATAIRIANFFSLSKGSGKIRVKKTTINATARFLI